MVGNKLIARFLIVTVISAGSLGFVRAQSVSELKTEAAESFEKGFYENSYYKYSKLIKKYPKDGLFHYYAGVSLCMQNKDYDKVINLLEYASSASTVPADVFYYLGLSYRKKYMFNEAKIAFQKFAESGERIQLKELRPAHEAEMSANAITQTMYYNPFEVLAMSEFTFKNEKYTNNVRGKGGKLSIKPEAFYARNEDHEEYSGYMFKPRTINKGDYLYFAGYGHNKRKGTDLFRIKKTNGKNWSEPEAIEELNTDFDEIMPYYDPVGMDLYFASRGHNSMGGFDVFKSHYDLERDTWSEPVSMGFPVNSPDNEYLFMPGPDLGTVVLISDREGHDSLFTVYKLRLKEPKESLASASSEELMKIGKFGGVGSAGAMPSNNKQDEVNSLEKESPEPVSDKQKKLVEDKAKTDQDSPYQQNLKLALDYQVKSDSLAEIAREARIKASSITDANERWKLQKKIIEWEKYSSEYQDKANELYSNLYANDSHKEKIPETIEKDTSINDITVYKYKTKPIEKTVENALTQDTVVPEENPKKENEQVLKEPGEAIKAFAKEKDSSNRFYVLKTSPYSDNNPFPKDIVLPKGAFYRIQLGVFSEEKPYGTFGGISPITCETIKEKGLIRYYAGKFDDYNHAQNALNEVKSLGYKDAYIVSWFNGDKLPGQKVKELQKRNKQ